jgi:hypothetical protein
LSNEGYKREDFKSPLEYNVYRYLKQQAKEHKFKIGYETEKLEYVLVKNYVPDFVLTFPDGRKVYLEAKGYLRGEDRAKLLAVKDRHPELDLHLVFSKDNRLNKRARSRYSDWAKRHKIPHAISTIPVDWLSG